MSAGPVDLRRTLVRGAAILGLTLAVLAVLALAVWRMDPGAAGLGDIARRSDLGLLALAVSLISLVPVTMALRWRALLPGRPAPLPLAGFQCVGLLFNYALPGPVGEAVAAVLAARRYGLEVATAVAALVVGRLVGLAVACAVAGALFIAAPFAVPPEVRPLADTAAAILVALAVALGALTLWPQVPRRGLEPLTAWMARAPGAVGRLGGRVHRFSVQLLDALGETAARGWRALAEAVAWSLASHVVVASGILLAAHAMGMAPAWLGVVFTYTASTAGTVLLFLFPGSHLGWDVSFGALLALTTGLSVSDAAAVTVVVRVQHSLVILVGVAGTWLVGRDLLPSRVEASLPE